MLFREVLGYIKETADIKACAAVPIFMLILSMVSLGVVLNNKRSIKNSTITYQFVYRAPQSCTCVYTNDLLKALCNIRNIADIYVQWN